jgi:hypothetical protein
MRELQRAMLGLATLLLCRCCGAATAQFQRGWRAYVDEEQRSVEIVCPACAERERGEDESI